PMNELCDYVLLKMAEVIVDFDLEPSSIIERETYKETSLWKVTAPIDRLDNASPMTGPLTYIVGLNDDMLVFAFGVAPTVADTLKKAIDDSGKAAPVPREIVVYSADRIGNVFKTLGIDAIADENQEDKVVMDIIDSIPEDARIVVAQDVEANVLTWTCVYSGKLWPTVGRFLDIIIEQSNGRLPWSFNHE
ncbi:MAG: hypothetical protein FWD31_04305, partial [Planctomycetaceae bacterium]|nr:hypothetical protein [Planctomycetaceae bacterium]